MQMVEHRAARLANAQRIHERRRLAAGSPSATSAAPWAACLATFAKPASTCTGRPAITPASRRVSSSRTPATPASRPERITSQARGADTASAATAFTALSTYASHARRPRGVPGAASASADASAVPAIVEAPPPNRRRFDDRAGKKRDFAVERARGAHAERS